MDQEDGGVRKRKRKPKENAGERKRKRGGGCGEPQQQDKAAAIAAVVGKVAECVQQEEENYRGISEESIAQMMNWLALDLAMPAADGVGTNAGTSPPVAPVAGYGTVQGNTQSCGPSFSGSASTVMASVDVRFLSPIPPAVPWPWPETAPGPQEEEAVDDEWVAGLLTDGPSED